MQATQQLVQFGRRTGYVCSIVAVDGEAIGGRNVVGVLRACLRDKSPSDRDASRLVHAELGALDEVREVELEERQPPHRDTGENAGHGVGGGASKTSTRPSSMSIRWLSNGDQASRPRRAGHWSSAVQMGRTCLSTAAKRCRTTSTANGSNEPAMTSSWPNVSRIRPLRPAGEFIDAVSTAGVPARKRGWRPRRETFSTSCRACPDNERLNGRPMSPGRAGGPTKGTTVTPGSAPSVRRGGSGWAMYTFTVDPLTPPAKAVRPQKTCARPEVCDHCVQMMAGDLFRRKGGPHGVESSWPIAKPARSWLGDSQTQSGRLRSHDDKVAVRWYSLTEIHCSKCPAYG